MIKQPIFIGFLVEAMDALGVNGIPELQSILVSSYADEELQNIARVFLPKIFLIFSESFGASSKESRHSSYWFYV